MSRDAEPRIVSLLPAATEFVYALGLGDRLVGVSHECDHPEAALKLPRVTRSLLGSPGTSRAIDEKVKEARSGRRPIVAIDATALRALRPTVLLTQTLCDVCALTPEDVAKAIEGLDPAPMIVPLQALDLESMLADARRLGDLFDRGEEAKALVFRQWRLTKEIRARVGGLDPPNVAILDWVDPVMFAGNWVPELAAIAGGRYTLVERGKPSRWGSWEELEDAEPDVIVAAPCGRSVTETRSEIGAQLARFRPGDLAALDAGRVFMADGHQFFSRAGPRLIYSAALMARAFHPDAVPPLPAALESQLVQWRP